MTGQRGLARRYRRSAMGTAVGTGDGSGGEVATERQAGTMASRSTSTRGAIARTVVGAKSPRRGTLPRSGPSAPARLVHSEQVVDPSRLHTGAAVLEALHLRLAADLVGLSAASDDRNPYGSDFEGLVTAAQAATQVGTDELLRCRVERRLAEIEAVQARMRAGTYGTCDTCGVLIPEGRLEALPEAVHCLDCQRAHDRVRARRAGAHRAA